MNEPLHVPAGADWREPKAAVLDNRWTITGNRLIPVPTRTKPCEENCPKCGASPPKAMYVPAMYGLPDRVSLRCTTCEYSWSSAPLDFSPLAADHAGGKAGFSPNDEG